MVKKATKKSPAKKVVAKKAPAKKKVVAKKAPAKKVVAKKAPAKKKVVAKKAPAKKKVVAKKAPTIKKKVVNKKAPPAIATGSTTAKAIAVAQKIADAANKKLLAALKQIKVAEAAAAKSAAAATKKRKAAQAKPTAASKKSSKSAIVAKKKATTVVSVKKSAARTHKLAHKTASALVSKLNGVIAKLAKEEKKIEAAVARFRLKAVKKLGAVEARLVKIASKPKSSRGRPKKSKKK